jgi:hypothetical protein
MARPQFCALAERGAGLPVLGFFLCAHPADGQRDIETPYKIRVSLCLYSRGSGLSLNVSGLSHVSWIRN